MYQSRYHVTVLKVEIVVRSKDVSGNHTGKHAAVLFMIGPEKRQLDGDHST